VVAAGSIACGSVDDVDGEAGGAALSAVSTEGVAFPEAVASVESGFGSSAAAVADSFAAACPAASVLAVAD
jgi:hypothetical protein